MAANPGVVVCPANTWQPVALAVFVGTLHRLSNVPAKYVQSFRIAGEAPPADDTDAAPIFTRYCAQSSISSDARVDVYIKAVRRAGLVRVDL